MVTKLKSINFCDVGGEGALAFSTNDLITPRQALEEASNLLDSAVKISTEAADAAGGSESSMMHGSTYLMQMAKALVDSVATSPIQSK